MKQLQVNKTERIAMSKSRNLMLRNALVAILLVVGISQVNAQDRAQVQEKIFSIDAFSVGGALAAPMQTMAAGRMAQPSSADDTVLQAEQVATFRSLYYDLQPTLSYDRDEVLDMTDGKQPLVISVHPNAFSRLENDMSNRDFSLVKLIIIQDAVSGTLPAWLLDTSKDGFPSLDYVVINNQAGQNVIAQPQVETMARSANDESREYLIFVYNNLEIAN